MHFGACYYPEHWTPEQAKDHVPLMRKAGINVVRMGEFAWCKFEPEQGRYRFDWLDGAVAALAQAGIAMVLCTPTCIPPPWAVQRHPTILQVDRDGRTRNPGARCHACKNAPEFRLLAEQITQAVAKHYADVDGVIGWQTDNEFGCHGTTRCYCDNCEKAFRDWLLEKYGDVETVNAAWGTAFWGFEFRQWNEVPLPKRMPTGSNPGHWLDFARFSSDTQVAFHKTQYDLIKSLCPNHFVTHNLMGRFSEIDYYQLAQWVDFPAWDNYPDSRGDPLDPAYAHAITRASVRGRPDEASVRGRPAGSFKDRFWVMEQKSGPTGDARTGLLGEAPEPGDLRRWTWQAVANGADGVVYFRWRPCLTGAEQYWHGILDHDGVPRQRFAEVRKTGAEVHKVAAALEGTTVNAPVALIRSFEILWSLERQPGAPTFSYDDHCFAWFRAVKRNSLDCDVVDVTADLARYKVVVAPCLALVDAELAGRLDAFVQAGGLLVLTPQSGVRTPTNAMSDKTRPGLLADLAGVTIDEVRAYHHGQTHEIRFVQGRLAEDTCPVGAWLELLRCDTAMPVAVYVDGPWQGKPAMTGHDCGDGRVYYLGVLPPEDTLAKFLVDLLPPAPIGDLPPGIEVAQRQGPQGRLVFLINHTPEGQRLLLPGTLPELLSGKMVGPKVAIAPGGVLILKA